MAARVTSPVLVGRADQLAALHAAIERVRQGGPAALLIGGEAGVGKSRLLREFSARARGDGARIMVGGCLELAHGGLPFAPFMTMLRELVRDLGAARVAELVPGRGTRELARLVPEFDSADDRADGEAEPGEARARLFEQILSLLEALAESGPVVLVIEDLHWADRSSRDLLAFLVSNQRSADGLLIIGSYRSDELHRTHPLRPLLAELDRIDWVERAELPRLSRRHCLELVTGILGREADPSLADGVYERTEGNPLFVEALLDRDGAPGRGLPESLQDLLAASVRRLPEETQDVLRMASAAGERVGHALLAAVSGLGEDALAAVLRPAVAGNVLVTDADGYAFRHALIREVVYEDLMPGEHGRLHTRFAEAIDAGPSLVPAGRAAIEVAHHAYAAHDVTWALISAWRAAREAARGLAHAEQLSMLSRVLELWDKVPDAAERIGVGRLDVLQEAAQVAFDSWETERAMALASAALKEVDVAAEPVRAAMLLERRGLMAHFLGREDALADLRRAQALVPADPPSAARARVLRSIARVLWESDQDEALATGQQAIAIAHEVADVETELQAIMNLAVIESGRGTGRAGEALRLLARARALGERAGYRALLRVSIIESHLLEEMGEHDRAADVARDGIASARESGLIRTDGAVLALNVAEPLISLGRWAEAEETLEHALDYTPPPRIRSALRVLAGDVALARGDIRSAADAAAAASAYLADTGYEAQLRLPLVRLQVALRVAAWRPAEALAVLEDALDQFAMQHAPRYAWPLLIAGARACAAAAVAGKPARDHALQTKAGVLLGRVAALADKLAAVGPVQEASRLTFAAEAARAAAACGLLAGAAPAGTPSSDAWDEVAAAWELHGQPYPRAEALLRAAEIAIAEGDREGGRARLLVAVRLADRVGARPLGEEIRLLARRARIVLTRDDSRPGAADGSAPGAADAQAGGQGGPRDGLGLTDREFEVLRLVAAGKSNREIADELFISAKTASVHVSNIMAKLGVASRGEAAASAYRLRLFDTLPTP